MMTVIAIWGLNWTQLMLIEIALPSKLARANDVINIVSTFSTCGRWMVSWLAYGFEPVIEELNRSSEGRGGTIHDHLHSVGGTVIVSTSER